ncbi:RHS repeat-associated core domain-containing protein [Pseudomonas sp. EA_65y_Pfl2_P74]|uniref:RHS repeat-associated core domain-containing protein n=1 Tax=Pseudomonas sp. EA_65y_Pfl2_P74 TaxID=3088694 RepID=UPI0030D9DAFD
MTHANTPAIQAFDARGLVLRSVNYHRRDETLAPESYITHQTHDAAGRTVLSRDPRLFREHTPEKPGPANQSNVFSLSGAMLSSENSDAGWRLSLLAEDGAHIDGWDQKRNHSRIVHDALRRPSATFEQSGDEPEHCTERFTYFDDPDEVHHNRRGRLIRHDDTAGTLHFTELSMSGQPLQLCRTFSADPAWAVDWPEVKVDRDFFLETRSAATHFSYNALGESVGQTDALGNRQIQLQDVAGHVKETRLTLAANDDSQTLVSDIHYNAFGLIEQQRAGNDVISQATFSLDDGRLQRLRSQTSHGSILQDLSYAYDAVGNITRISDSAEAAVYHRNQRTDAICRYRYDSLSRLIEASGRQIRNAAGGPQLPAFASPADPGQLENYTRTYTYDPSGNLLLMEHRAASGNRTERTVVASASNRSLPESPDGHLPDEQAIAAAYDANGNRVFLQDEGQTLQWDRRNELQQVDQVVREGEPNDCEFYIYDGSGQRLRKIRQACTASVQRLSETRYLPGLETRTDPNQTVHVITVKAGRATIQVLHFEKPPPHGIPQHQQRYSFTDQLNSSTIELDAQAQMISRESYYPFGGTCWWAGRSLVEASYKTLRYSGKERDASGLYYYGFRYYTPWLQRWLNADPLGVQDGLNLFAMVHGNPVGNVDFQGLVTLKEGVGAALATFGRDSVSALAAGAVKYFAARGLEQWATGDPDSPPDPGVNLGLTLAGSMVGALAGGSMGIGAGSRIASSRNYNRTTQKVMAGILGLAGAAAGAAAPLYAYLSERETLNMTAISILASVPKSMTREAGQRAFASVGPSVTIAPSGTTTAWRTAFYGAVLFADGALGANLPPGLDITVAATVEGLDGASTTTINSLRGGDYSSPERNRLSVPNAAEWLYGVVTRTAGSTLTASLTLLAEPLTNTIENAHLQSAVVESLATPTEARTYLGQHVQRGAFELARYDDGDFTLDRFTPANRIWRDATPAGYHPETPDAGDLPMSVIRRRSV